MDKKISILYFSPTGSTAKITKEIAKGIGNIDSEYDFTLLKNRNQYSELTFKDNELVVIGVPVYAGRIPDFLTACFSKIKADCTNAVFTVVYGNRDYDDALLELKNIFEEKGFVGIAAGAFIGEHSFTSKLAGGRPDTADISAAFNFGKKIKEKMEEHLYYSKDPILSVKGNFPYKEGMGVMKMVSETSEKCTSCGICAGNCPVDAIDSTNFKDIDSLKCIHCCSCIKKCPVNAKAFNNEGFMSITQRLINNFASVRREPELFL